MEQKWIYVYIYIQEQQPNQFHCYNQSWEQNGPEHGQVLVSEWKNGGGSRMFEW